MGGACSAVQEDPLEAAEEVREEAAGLLLPQWVSLKHSLLCGCVVRVRVCQTV